MRAKQGRAVVLREAAGRLRKDARGVTAIEYTLIAALIAGGGRGSHRRDRRGGCRAVQYDRRQSLNQRFHTLAERRIKLLTSPTELVQSRQGRWRSQADPKITNGLVDGASCQRRRSRRTAPRSRRDLARSYPLHRHQRFSAERERIFRSRFSPPIIRRASPGREFFPGSMPLRGRSS